MTDISKIDQNFIVPANFDTSALDIYNALEAPFKIYGLILPESETDRFRRIPAEIAENVSDSVYSLSCNTAGGRLRFKTNSSSIAIFAKMDHIGKMPHFALTGSAGFDLYADKRYKGTFVPPFDIGNGYSSLLNTGNKKEKSITITFPLYSDVVSLLIGLDRGSHVSVPDEYTFDHPIVYYGSSITQGGCASRPGNAYQEIISRRLDCDYINLGFSGSAKGEPEIAEYISNLRMKAFVYDYDHNAPTPDYLKNTHQRMFEAIRAKNPFLPVIMVSRPEVTSDNDTQKRLEIIKKTYDDAVQKGDQHVYFVDGGQMMRDFANDSATVDGCHPNDFGFIAMAKGIGDVLEKVII